MLKFKIQGSGKEPYTITAEGQGSTFRMFCTCPAGRKADMFCKHFAALLLGDVSKLVGSADDLPELATMADGTSYMDKARTHKPANGPDPWAHIKTLEDVLAEFGLKLSARGFTCEITRDPGELPHRLPCDELSLFETFRGNLRRTPSHTLSYLPFGGDVDEDGDPDVPTYVNVKDRVRPWRYKAGRGVDAKTRRTLSAILPDFLAGVGVK